MEKMERIVILLFFSYFLCFGCSSSSKIPQTYFDQEYSVIDKGGKNVIVKSKACSIFQEKATSNARRSAKFHLRSIIGSKGHEKKFKKIRKYYNGQKTCIEIIAKGVAH